MEGRWGILSEGCVSTRSRREEDTDLRQEVTCDRFGKTLAYTQVQFYNAKKVLVARGSHTKYIAQAYGHKDNITDELKTSDVTKA